MGTVPAARSLLVHSNEVLFVWRGIFAVDTMINLSAGEDSISSRAQGLSLA